MAEKPWELDDPFELVASEVPDPEGKAWDEMARCFVEEMVRMGWSREKILHVFQQPFYHGPYQIWSMKGRDFVEGLIQEVLAWRNPSKEVKHG